MLLKESARSETSRKLHNDALILGVLPISFDIRPYDAQS